MHLGSEAQSDCCTVVRDQKAPAVVENNNTRTRLASILAAVCVVAMAISCSGPQPVLCRSFPDLQPLACDISSNGTVFIPVRSLSQLSFENNQPAAILVRDRDFYFVNSAGKTAPAFKFDNGPDYFVEGLARTIRNGKIGFVNAQLDEVIPPVWDFAAPFDHGRAQVCSGCIQEPLGEHSIMTGGKWGYIDQHGNLVEPLTAPVTSKPK